MAKKKKALVLKEHKDYVDFLKKVNYGRFDSVDVTHDGYPLSTKESKFISVFIANGDINKSLKDSGLTLKNLAGKDYITDEITYRLEQLKKVTIADADEILQYLTSVMRGEVKDQFGLDAPLSERTNAAKELARRIIDTQAEAEQATPELKITLCWDGLESE